MENGADTPEKGTAVLQTLNTQFPDDQKLYLKEHTQEKCKGRNTYMSLQKLANEHL